MVRTVEQILGITPMNQLDLAAKPMYDAFQSTPNDAPFIAAPNQIPLTLGVPGYSSTLVKAAAANARALAKAEAVPASEMNTFDAWMSWSKHQRFTGRHALEDHALPALLNRLDWYSAHDWRLAYPGDPHIYAPNQVPATALLAGDNTDG